MWVTPEKLLMSHRRPSSTSTRSFQGRNISRYDDNDETICMLALPRPSSLLLFPGDLLTWNLSSKIRYCIESETRRPPLTWNLSSDPLLHMKWNLSRLFSLLSLSLLSCYLPVFACRSNKTCSSHLAYPWCVLHAEKGYSRARKHFSKVFSEQTLASTFRVDLLRKSRKIVKLGFQNESRSSENEWASEYRTFRISHSEHVFPSLPSFHLAVTVLFRVRKGVLIP